MKLDIAINYVCSWLFFDVSTLKHVLNNVKPMISQFLQPYDIRCCIQKKESGL